VAEGNLVNPVLATRLLERQAHSVVTAVDGRKALRAFDANPFGLILMDVQMPDLDGYQNTRKFAGERCTVADFPLSR
jgi:CheY-like chemotaxis protein